MSLSYLFSLPFMPIPIGIKGREKLAQAHHLSLNFIKRKNREKLVARFKNE